MPEKQYARGLWASFLVAENPFQTPNGMEENLRTIDDLLALSTQRAPVPPGTLPADPGDGDGQIFTDGTYATYNGGAWKTYGPRKGVRAVLATGTESWLNVGTSWEQFSVLDTSAATAAAEAARDQAEGFANAAAAGVGVAIFDTIALGMAGTSSGQLFMVLKGGTDGLVRTTTFKNNAGTPLIVVDPASGSEVTAISDKLLNTEEKLETLYQADEDLFLPIGGITNPARNVQWVADYSLAERRMRVNGIALPDQRMLGDRLFGQYIAAETADTENLLPIAGITNPLGQVQAVAYYDLLTRRFIVNGTASGGLPMTYAPPEAVSGAQTPVFTAVMHLMTYGQSLSKGVASTPPYSAIQPYNNLTFAQGPRSTKAGSVGLLPGMDAFIPLIENTLNGDAVDVPQSGETPCSGWANGLTRRLAVEGEDWRTSGRQFLGSANGKGSASITQLLPGGTTDLGEWFQVVRDAITQGHALAVAAGKTYSMPLWVYMQGEGDNANAAYAGGVWRTSLQTMHGAVTTHYQAETGGAYVPWLGVYQTYARTRRERPHATIDQLDYCETAANAFHLTALYHLPLAADGHLSALGSYWVGQYAAKKSRQLLAGHRPQWMRLGTATISGQVVRYRPREIPVSPLRLSVDEHVRPCVDYGFLVRDDNGTCDIESIGIGPHGDEVVITLVSPTTGNVQLRYGLDYLPTGQVDYSGSAGGNLIDSDPETFEYDGARYPLINVCPHFQLDVIPI